jgi:restriction system protein
MVASVLFTTAVKSPTINLEPVFRGLLHGTLPLWPLFAVIAIAAIAKVAYRIYCSRRLAKSGIAEVDQMDGRTFEQFLGTLFRRLDYGVEVTKYRGDYGADLVVTRNGVRTAVQAKRWSKNVGLKAVQEAVAARGLYQCQRALVVANRPFTRQARRLADANHVELWDRDVLISKLLATRSSEATKPSPGDFANADAVPQTAAVVSNLETAACCAACGNTVSDKVRDYCLAHQMRFGGEIYCYMHQRKTPPPLAVAD